MRGFHPRKLAFLEATPSIPEDISMPLKWSTRSGRYHCRFSPVPIPTSRICPAAYTHIAALELFEHGITSRFHSSLPTHTAHKPALIDTCTGLCSFAPRDKRYDLINMHANARHLQSILERQLPRKQHLNPQANSRDSPIACNTQVHSTPLSAASAWDSSPRTTETVLPHPGCHTLPPHFTHTKKITQTAAHFSPYPRTVNHISLTYHTQLPDPCTSRGKTPTPLKPSQSSHSSWSAKLEAQQPPLIHMFQPIQKQSWDCYGSTQAWILLSYCIPNPCTLCLFCCQVGSNSSFPYKETSILSR